MQLLYLQSNVTFWISENHEHWLEDLLCSNYEETLKLKSSSFQLRLRVGDTSYLKKLKSLKRWMLCFLLMTRARKLSMAVIDLLAVAND